MPSGGKRNRVGNRVGDAEIRERAASAGLALERKSPEVWVVNGVTMSRLTLLNHLMRWRRTDGRPFGYMHDDQSTNVPMNEMWRLAREAGSTLTLHVDGTVTLDANAPRSPGHVYSNLRAAAASPAVSRVRANWNLARRAQQAFGCNVKKIGAYWRLDNGISCTTERLEQLVTEREQANAAAA